MAKKKVYENSFTYITEMAWLNAKVTRNPVFSLWEKQFIQSIVLKYNKKVPSKRQISVFERLYKKSGGIEEFREFMRFWNQLSCGEYVPCFFHRTELKFEV